MAPAILSQSLNFYLFNGVALFIYSIRKYIRSIVCVIFFSPRLFTTCVRLLLLLLLLALLLLTLLAYVSSMIVGDRQCSVYFVSIHGNLSDFLCISLALMHKLHKNLIFIMIHDYVRSFNAVFVPQ